MLFSTKFLLTPNRWYFVPHSAKISTLSGFFLPFLSLFINGKPFALKKEQFIMILKYKKKHSFYGKQR